MSVKEIRANIQAAISQLHEAQVKWERTPAHYKYLEISDLMLKVDEQYTQLQVLDMKAADCLRKVLKREGKNPDAVRP